MKNVFLGLSGVYGHDAAATLIVDGNIVAACEEERFIHEKHTGRLPINAIDFCLDYADIEPKNVDFVSFPFNYKSRLEPVLIYNLSVFEERIKYYMDNKTDIKKIREDAQKIISVEKKIMHAHRDVETYVKNKFPNAEFKVVDHHLAHAASSYYLSGFNSSSVLIVDLIGEWATVTKYAAKDNKLIEIDRIYFPDSLGKIYQTFTKFLGFKPYSDEFKVMGLAAYGTNKYVSFFHDVVHLMPEGRFKVNQDLMLFCKGIRPEWSERVVDVIGMPKKKDEAFEQRHADIAFGLQELTENVLLHLVKDVVLKTNESDLCMAGGVALNALANQKIRESGFVKNLFVQPASYDAGTSLGASIVTYLSEAQKPLKTLNNYYLGPEYSDQEINQVLEKQKIKYELYRNSFQDLLNIIKNDGVVGIFQGRMEFGPRALGNRSILASPSNSAMKDILNTKIKFREEFRPFAPIILEEEVKNYFEYGVSSPYMTQTFTAKPITRRLAPAIVHEDGTSRIQTINKNQNSRIYSLLENISPLIGVPILINTSFNLAGDTIVNTPEDALKTFYRSDIDALVLGDYIIRK